MKQYLIPPGYFWLFKNFWAREANVTKIQESPDADFQGEEFSFLREALGKSKYYGEYGVGASTTWVYRNFGCQIRAVETDAHWIELATIDAAFPRCEIVHVDVGPIESWGYPRTYASAEKFPQYFDAIFGDNFSPDVILIDGRFRVACFLTSVKRAKPGTIIIFDDYPERPLYHVVEEVLSPEKVGSRQAKFIVPAHFDLARLDFLLGRFSYVLD
jgi:hypothetical protein